MLKLTKPWCLIYKYEESGIQFPKNILFEDFLCKNPKKVIDIKGWKIGINVIEIIKTHCQLSTSITLDSCVGLSVESLQLLRGLQNIKRFSAAFTNICLDTVCGEIFGSWKQLHFLNISGCDVEVGLFVTISYTCVNLKTLVMSKCKGLNDFCLRALGQCLQRFRKLERVDVSYCRDFGDEGLLDLITAGYSILSDINISHCKQITGLGMAGLRNKMSNLKKLSIPYLLTLQTSFEWISEGCRELRYLDMPKSPELDNSAFIKIGRWCRHLIHLNIANCVKITDEGMFMFMERFDGLLQYLDISGCIQCGSISILAIAKKSSELSRINVNGLSSISANALEVLFDQSPNLKHFEMCSELRTTITHRRSMMPHLADSVFLQANYHQLIELRIAGASKVTDEGICAVITKCANTLQVIDVSYCHNITNYLMEFLSQRVHKLHTLIISACINITNDGIIAISNGTYLPLTLKILEMDGCWMITDTAMSQISKFKNLESLTIKSCDQISDATIIQIAMNCQKIKNLDIMNLDLVGQPAIHALMMNCPNLVKLHCDGCRLPPHEFYQLTDQQFPFINPLLNKCRAIELPLLLKVYNLYVQDIRRKDQAIRIIQRFGDYILRTVIIRLAQKLKQKKFNDLRKIFYAFKNGVKELAMENKLALKNFHVNNLQEKMHHLMGFYYAKKKVKYLREKKKSLELIQRVYRGYLGRKRIQKLFYKLFYFYHKFSVMVKKIQLLHKARQLHKKILLVQSIGRMFIQKWKYQQIIYGLQTFQIRYHYYMKQKQFRLQKNLLKENLLKEQLEKYKAATFLQRNLMAKLFNYKMFGFLIVCGIYFRTDYDEKKWNILKIQKVWRGYMIRLKRYRNEQNKLKRNQSAIKIQSIIRKYLTQLHIFPIRNDKRRLYLQWKRLFVYGKPRLILGNYVKKIQKEYRRYFFMLLRHLGATYIQTIFRGYYTRNRLRKEFLLTQIESINKIKRTYRIHYCRLQRKWLKYRQHMAVWKIESVADKIFHKQRIKKKYAEEKKLERNLIQNEKKDKLRIKREFIVAKIRQTTMNRYARKIQGNYRKWKAARKLEDEIAQQEAVIAADAAELKQLQAIKPKLNLKNAILTPLKSVWGVAQSIAHPGQVISHEDHPRLQTSVLKYQSKSIIQEGLVEMVLTVGEAEYNTFESRQNTLRKAKLTYLSPLEGDLSGSLSLRLHLWILYGKGRDAICFIELQNKPNNQSLAALKLRETTEAEKGIKIIWHQHIPFEILAYRTYSGKGDFAIQKLWITETAQAEDEAKHQEFTCIANMSRYGMKASFYALMRATNEDHNLYKTNFLEDRYDWMNEKLLKVIKTYNLSEQDVHGFKSIFDDLISARNRTTLTLEELFYHFQYPLGELAKWAVNAVDPIQLKEINFTEYVHFVCYYCLMSTKDLMKFLFINGDTDKKEYLRQDQFLKLIIVMAEFSPFTHRTWINQYEKHYDKKLGHMFFSNFEKFVISNPSALGQAQALQVQLMRYNFGETFWRKKAEQFRLIREQLGVKVTR